jgi:hypothetical protein
MVHDDELVGLDGVRLERPVAENETCRPNSVVGRNDLAAS